MVSEVVAVDGDTAVVAHRWSTAARTRRAGVTCGCSGSAWTVAAVPSRSGRSPRSSPTGTEDQPGGTTSDALLDQAGVDVVEEPADGDRVGDQRVAAHLAYVVAERGLLVLDDAEVLPGGVLAG